MHFRTFWHFYSPPSSPALETCLKLHHRINWRFPWPNLKDMDTLFSKTRQFLVNFYVFSHASAKAEHGLSILSCVWMYVDQNQDPPPQKWHIHWEFLDFKSGFGFTTKIYPRLIFIFKWMPSNDSDTNLFLILQNYLRPFQQWMPLSSPNHSAN